jgi:hypothetical protein
LGFQQLICEKSKQYKELIWVLHTSLERGGFNFPDFLSGIINAWDIIGGFKKYRSDQRRIIRKPSDWRPIGS